jgi:Family of unknown function (DUF5335)
VAIPRSQWEQFLRSFSQQHERWQVQLETHDLETGETVLSPETPLKSIELDLEDERNPRINVVVKLDNKVVKHILFRPSHVVLHPARQGAVESLHIDSVHTATTVRLRRLESLGLAR